jgi:hypothetical protein
LKKPSFRDEKLRAMAEANGCFPFWADGILRWKYHCGCEDDFHCCSVISRESARRRRGGTSSPSAEMMDAFEAGWDACYDHCVSGLNPNDFKASAQKFFDE